MDRIETSLAEYKSWIRKLGISAISDVNRIIRDGRVSWLVNVSEIWHEQNISEIAKAIQSNSAYKRLIFISGPSSSGKTTFATRLQLHLRVLGIRAVSISLDDYYIDNEAMPKNREGKPDFEALEAIDYMRFNENVEDLINGKEAILPIYSFGKRPNSERRMRLKDDEVIIVEGIHGLNEKLAANIPGENKYKIYCSALTALSMDDGTRIKSRTNRLIRRLIRDYYFRSSSYSFTLSLWPHVEEGAVKNIYPYTDTADIIFNSSLLYEPAVYRQFLNKIFKDVTEDDEYYETIFGLLSLVNSFEHIEPEIVPRTSLIREFIGGSSLNEG